MWGRGCPPSPAARGLWLGLGGRLCGRRWALSASLGARARACGHLCPAPSRQGVHRGPEAGAEALYQPGGPAPALLRGRGPQALPVLQRPREYPGGLGGPGGPGAPGSLCHVVSVRSLCLLPWFGPNAFCFHGVAMSRAVSPVAWEALGRACWRPGRIRGFSAGPRGLKLLRGRGLHGWGLASGPAAPDVHVCALRKGQGGPRAVAELQLDVCPGRCGPSVPVTLGRHWGGRVLL